MEQANIKTHEIGLKQQLKFFAENKESLPFVEIGGEDAIIHVTHIDPELVMFSGEVKLRKLVAGDTPKEGILKINDPEEQNLFIDLESYTYVRYGAGAMTLPNLIMINGIWIDDLLEGEAQVVYHGDKEYFYQAVCVNGLMNDSAGYRQYFQNGACIIDYPGGAKWIGGAFEILEHGQGIKYFPDGSTYEGEVVFGRYQGTGRYTWPNGDVYEGQWLRGNRHGQGVKTLVGGENQFIGEWKLDKMTGKGSFISPLGRYDGQWLNGLQHGKGVITQVDGSTYEATFEAGRLKQN